MSLDMMPRLVLQTNMSTYNREDCQEPKTPSMIILLLGPPLNSSPSLWSLIRGIFTDLSPAVLHESHRHMNAQCHGLPLVSYTCWDVFITLTHHHADESICTDQWMTLRAHAITCLNITCVSTSLDPFSAWEKTWIFGDNCPFLIHHKMQKKNQGFL